MTSKSIGEIVFSRGEAAKILYITTATIANREKCGIYPPSRRDINNYRVYSLRDIMNLQIQTYNHINTIPIIEVLFDKGYTDIKQISIILERAIREKTL